MLNYSNAFKDYRNLIESNNKGPYYKNGSIDVVERLLTEYDVNKHAIEDYFLNNKNPKRRTKNILEQFNQYLKKQKVKEEELLDLPKETFYDTDVERRLSILKMIHEPQKTKQIAEALSLDSDTVNKHIATFKEGYTFMDTEIKVDIKMDKWKRYCKSNVHPIFLALNSTELNHLMTYISKSQDKEIQGICETIYTQLSQYAKDFICKNITNVSDDVYLEYHDEYDHASTDALGYLMKVASVRKPKK